MSDPRTSFIPRGRILLPSLVAGEVASFSLYFRVGAHSWLLVALFGLVLGGWICLCVWTWRRLARTRDAENGRIVYDFGVIGWGLSMALSMAAISAAREVGGFSHAFTIGFLGAFLQHAVIGFPIWLWGGYLWGRTMGAIFTPRR